MTLTAEKMQTLPHFFSGVADPRRPQGRRHSLTTILAIATGAILCGADDYQAISEWANDLQAKSRERFRCRRDKRCLLVPSLAIDGKTITADALQTQRDLAKYLVETRGTYYHFTAKGNQAMLFDDLKLFFEDRKEL